MDKIDAIIQKYYKVVFCVFVVGGELMYLSLCGGKYVWCDEAYTFSIIKHSYKEIWNITAADVHPPLYYFLLKLFIEPFDYALFSAKLFSICPYIIIILFGGIQLKRLFNEKTALLFMGLFLIYPFMLTYVVEIRMYSVAAMFVFFNVIYGYRCYIEDKISNWVIFVLAGTCAAYTHYFAMVSVGVSYGLLLLFSIRDKSKLRKWLFAAICTILLYLPWMSCFIEQLAYKVSNEYWISDITLSTLRTYVQTIFGAKGITKISSIFMVTYLAAFVQVMISRDKKYIGISICALAIPVGTIGVGVLASILVRPIFVIRYVVPAIPILILFLAIVLGKTRNQALIAFCLTVAFLAGYNHYSEILEEKNQVVDNALDADFLSMYEECDGYIMLGDKAGPISYELTYYESEKPIYRTEPTTAMNPNANHVYIEELKNNEHECIMLFVDVGGEVPDEYKELYNCEFLGEINSCGNLADTYLLKK